MDDNPNFGIIADFLLLTPLLWAVRALVPRAATVQVGFLLAGAYALYTVAPRFLPFFAAYWVGVFVLQWVMRWAVSARSAIASKLVTTACILAALSPMVIWKLWPGPFVEWVTETFAHLIWQVAPSFIAADSLAAVVAPLGLSFVVFRALDLLIKVRLELLTPLSPLELGYYGFFAPVLAVGPIVEYEEVRLERKGEIPRLPVAGDVAVGLFRVAIGALKVLVVARALNILSTQLWSNAEPTVVEAWLALWSYGLFFYVNFSGYSDLAIGATRLHGVRLKENFNNPFLKTNPQAFWASWHMSLTRWCQRYVFIPLGGMRASRQYLAIFFTIMAIALWHGIGMNMVAFGVYHAAFLIGHRWLENRRIADKRPLAKGVAPRIAKSLGVFFYQTLAFPMFALPLQAFSEFYGKFIPGF